MIMVNIKVKMRWCLLCGGRPHIAGPLINTLTDVLQIPSQLELAAGDLLQMYLLVRHSRVSLTNTYKIR